mmetsp:Transcript_119464/g.283581  ORF Transcript_119464/g.283581 Transcript_119464/m.283581 type:complete len:236 (-) Transcript_119464:229-936(-)
MPSFRLWIASTYLCSASLPSTLRPVGPLVAARVPAGVIASCSLSGPRLATSGVAERASITRRAAEPTARLELAGLRPTSPSGGEGSASSSAPSDLAFVAFSAEYADDRARSAAARRILFWRLAPLIWSSKNLRSSSSASALAFHLSTSFLYPLQSSSSRSACVMKRSSSPSSALILVSSRVLASSCSAFIRSSLISFWTLYMWVLYARKKSCSCSLRRASMRRSKELAKCVRSWK